MACGGAAVGGSGGEVKLRREERKRERQRSDHLEPQVLSNIVSAPHCLSFTIWLLFFFFFCSSEAYSRRSTGNTNTLGGTGTWEHVIYQHHCGIYEKKHTMYSVWRAYGHSIAFPHFFYIYIYILNFQAAVSTLHFLQTQPYMKCSTIMWFIETQTPPHRALPRIDNTHRYWGKGY